MAEAAGLAVGVLALMNTFRDCIDLFSNFMTAGRDYELLSAKLDVEKALLLQWADRTRLLKPEFDARLNNSTVHSATMQCFRSIKSLLSDGDHLQQRYGVQEIKDETDASMGPSLSQSRMAGFAEDIKKLHSVLGKLDKLYIRTNTQRGISWGLKTRWAVCDKQKFGDLLRDLSYFVSRVGDLVPDTQNARQMAVEDLSAVKETKAIKVLFEAASGRDSVLAAVAYERLSKDCEDRILKCIRFPLMDDRQDSLQLPSPRTFE